MRRVAGAWAIVLASTILVGCSTAGPRHALGPCRQGRSFELDLRSGTGGQPTPEDAAAHARVPGFALPKSGWQVVSREGGEASLRSDGYQVHVVEGPDKTWQVDSGGRCR
jgi:hypothetical protein